MPDYHFDWLAKWAYYTPDKLFLREHERKYTWTYGEFNQLANNCADVLTTRYGIHEGDRIAVYSKNRAEYVLLFLACIKAGAILVPLNFRLTTREISTLLTDAAPALFLYETDFAENAERLKPTLSEATLACIDDFEALLKGGGKPAFLGTIRVTPETPVMILYTAGTTGLSKGAIINHRMLFWNAVNTGLRLDLTSRDHTQSYAPFFHTGGWNVLFTPFLLHGGSHTLLNSFNPELVLQLMEEERTTLLFGVPTMLHMMSDTPLFATADLSSVRYAIVGGAPMPIPLINTWHSKGIAIRQGYGLTEVGPNCFSLDQSQAIRKRGSIGFPNFFIETRVVTETGQTAATGQVGELWLRGDVVTPGYWRKEAETKQTITDGWFHTGDMVQFDDEGYYYVVDRKKNMFISGGENVYPAEIERYLFTHPCVKDAAVIGVPDKKWGETGRAFIVLQPGATVTAEELHAFCLQGLAKYKIPKGFIFTDALPLNAAGKTDRRLLLENFLNQQHS